jgi:hypothetical protein
VAIPYYPISNQEFYGSTGVDKSKAFWLKSKYYKSS